MPKRDHGFTLSETLIAMALTIIIVGAAVNAFNSSMRLADTARIVSEMNQSLQAGMSLMVRDMIQTGTNVPRSGIPIPNGMGALPVQRPGPLNGAGGPLTFPAAWEVIPSVIPGGGLGPVINGLPTDIITLIYADPTLPLNQFPLAGIAADGSNMTVNNATNIGGADGIRAGDIIMFSNALGNAIQMVSGVNNQVVAFAAGDPMGLNQRNAAGGSVMDLQSAPGVFPPTTATRMLLVSYYIDTQTDPNLPRLVRQIGLGPQLAIAMGLENIQVTFDLVDGVGNPTNVENPAAPNSPHQIRKINLFVSARSLDQNANTHQFMRNSMATQIGLRSLSYTDRYR